MNAQAKISNESRALNLFHAWMDGDLRTQEIQAMADIASDEADIEELKACEAALATIKSYSKGMR